MFKFVTCTFWLGYLLLFIQGQYWSFCYNRSQFKYSKESTFKTKEYFHWLLQWICRSKSPRGSKVQFDSPWFRKTYTWCVIQRLILIFVKSFMYSEFNRAELWIWANIKVFIIGINLLGMFFVVKWTFFFFRSFVWDMR